MDTEDTNKIAVMLAIAGWFTKTSELYFGALVIAIIAAMMRTLYSADAANKDERDCQCPTCAAISRFSRYFLTALALSLLFVHIGLWQEWGEQQTIAISGVAAFMGREIIEIVMQEFPRAVRKLINKKMGDDDNA